VGSVRWVANPSLSRTPSEAFRPFTPAVAAEVQAYHASWPDFRPTPLRSLAQLASHLGLRRILVKDESERFGLHAFKSLGGTYAVGRYLAEYLGLGEGAGYEVLKAHAASKPPVVFATATDGNHGVGVAWAARMLGHSARVYMPKGSAPSRVRAVEAVGGTVTVTETNYDETVRRAAREAAQQGWVLAQDTAWEGYERWPLAIMQGYMTLAAEAVEPFPTPDTCRLEPPTHVILQAGVGSFAASVVAYLANLLGPDAPTVILVEPTRAAPFYRSAREGTGQLLAVAGPLDTVMAGLACGVGNPVAWDILSRWVTAFVTVDDPVTARGMRILGNPLPGDPAVVAGESGAVGLGLLAAVMERPELTELRDLARLEKDSSVWLVNTEGATDPVMYRRIVWDGYMANGASRATAQPG